MTGHFHTSSGISTNSSRSSSPIKISPGRRALVAKAANNLTREREVNTHSFRKPLIRARVAKTLEIGGLEVVPATVARLLLKLLRWASQMTSPVAAVY